jgi:hypothetical protein
MKCPKCGFEQEERDVCEMCGLVFSKYFKRLEEDKRPIEEIETPYAEGIPWEERKILGFFPALFATIKESLFFPTSFFKRILKKGGYEDPIRYAMILYGIGIIGRTFLSLIFGRTDGGFWILIGLILWLFFGIIGGIIGLFIWSGIIHLFLRFVGSGGGGFQATFRVYSYLTSMIIPGLIPLVGGIMGGVFGEFLESIGGLVCLIWYIVLNVIGLREAHNTTTIKALLACFIIPIGIFILLIIFLILLTLLFGKVHLVLTSCLLFPI